MLMEMCPAFCHKKPKSCNNNINRNGNILIKTLDETKLKVVIFFTALKLNCNWF